MRKRSNLLLCAHCITTALFLAVPGLYIREILPVWTLPLVGILVILATVAFETRSIRFLPSLLIAMAGFSFGFFLIERGFGLLHTPQTDGIFLHIGLSAWVLILVCVFAFATTLAFIRFGRWRTIEPFILVALFCAFFWSQGSHSLTLFPHPVRAAAFIALFLAAILIQVVLSGDARAGALMPLIAYVPLAVVLLLAVLNSYNSLSVSNNGGLIQPTLFRFDFSPYLSLKNEIKLSDSLVMIVRTKEENAMTLLRRVYLAGWNPDKGFYEANPPDAEPQVTAVPRGQTRFPDPQFKLRTIAEQEFFIVNFDPSSFISMDYPTEAIPYRMWDSRNFNGAYAVSSKISGFMPFELYDCRAPSGNEPGMTAKDFSFYTEIDEPTKSKLAPLARDITKGESGYYDKILAINAFFHDGHYRYSLRPGTASDGDQLSHFLFVSKKGYCTYFAFSMCLLLRTLGIPSRVAAGFFIQPTSGTLDYYPIRANMAHAWVEVFFPAYGWISFDPTTTKVADGETIQFSGAPAGDDFYKLLDEIIDKRTALLPVTEGPRSTVENSPLENLAQEASAFLKKFWFAVSLAVAIGILGLKNLSARLAIRFSGNHRKVILLISRDLYRMLSAGGEKRQPHETKRSYVYRLQNTDVRRLYAIEQKARFAPECSERDAADAKRIYANARGRISPKARIRAFFSLFLIILACVPVYPDTGNTQTPISSLPENKILEEARSAIHAENWEGALNLLGEGIQNYPANSEFHYMLGTLYAKKEIYPSAYKELKTARDLGYSDTEIYFDLADVAGYLNEDENALAYLTIFLRDHDDDLFAWSNYGWLCYKTNRLDEGIKTLHRIIETHGADGNLYVGLGNLYTASFNYVEARKYYTLAIHTAERRKQAYLASIYYYNRSILEEAFYHFEDAYNDTTKSLAASARSSGYLMQGELELRRLNFMAAVDLYTRAINLDSTPLASMGLAETMIQTGNPDKALNYLAPILRKTELSWIANYGTTIDQYRADIESMLKDIYRYKMNEEKRKVVHSFSTYIVKAKKIIGWRIRYWYHDTLFRIQNKKVARYYEKAEHSFNSITSQDLYINSFYFLAFSKWRQIASPYLEKAGKIESGHIPEAQAAYTYEKARLLRSPALMDEAIRTLNPEWERKNLAKAVAERLLMEKKTSSPQYRNMTAQLFDLNPALFVAYNIKLPVRIIFPATDKKAKKTALKQIRKALLDAGFILSELAAYSIKITDEKEGIRISLLDNNRNATVYTQVVNNPINSPHISAQFINNFSTSVFRAQLQF